MKELMKISDIKEEFGLIGKNEKTSDYRDSFYAVNDSIRGHVSIDKICFPAPDERLKDWLDRLPENDYITPDIPSEAPEKSLAFRKAGILIIVWCNLFADPNEILWCADKSEWLHCDDLQRRRYFRRSKSTIYCHYNCPLSTVIAKLT